MMDTISRQAAIDAILHITNCKSVRELFEYNQEHHLTEMWSGGVNDAIDAVIGVESATDNNVGTKHSTNLAEVGTGCISREQAIEAVRATLLAWSFMPEWRDNKIIEAVEQLPPIQPEPHEIGYDDCANALLKMWMDNVLTDWVYHRITDKLNEKWGKTELPEPYKGVTE